MTSLDILFHIDSYPRPRSGTAIDQVVAVVGVLGGRVTALALAVRISLRSNRLADYLIKLTEIAQEAAQMGAYAHSRLREPILGGATEHVLHRPKTAVFLAR